MLMMEGDSHFHGRDFPVYGDDTPFMGGVAGNDSQGKNCRYKDPNRLHYYWIIAKPIQTYQLLVTNRRYRVKLVAGFY